VVRGLKFRVGFKVRWFWDFRGTSSHKSLSSPFWWRVVGFRQKLPDVIIGVGQSGAAPGAISKPGSGGGPVLAVTGELGSLDTRRRLFFRGVSVVPNGARPMKRYLNFFFRVVPLKRRHGKLFCHLVNPPAAFALCYPSLTRRLWLW